MDVATFLNRFESLPKKIQRQIIDLAETLIHQNSEAKVKQHGFSFDWENTLKKNKTAVDLQHEANGWR